MIKQGTEEWHKQRVGMVTGSRVGAILGLNPWQTRDEVMRAMVREYHGASSEFIGNVATEYGKRNEPNAIFELELEHGVTVQETGFHVHPSLPWLGASPDGLIGDDGLAEIKCPYSLRKGGEFKTLKQQPHYCAQLHIELACTERTCGYFYQWSPHGTMLELYHIDPFWLDANIPLLYEFYEEYLEALNNPEDYLIDGLPHSVAVDDYLAAKRLYDETSAALAAAKQELVKLADGKKTKIGDLLVYPIEKQGSISYAKAIKDLLPDADLEQYRGEPITTWGVK